MRSAEGCHCAIANGDLEWQSYFINWNHNYFDPALEKAHSIAATESRDNVKLRQTSSPSRATKPTSLRSRSSSPTKPKPKARSKSSPTVTDKHCPVCDSFLAEKSYTKDRETKKMLVCSSGRRNKTHEGVVYFLTKKKQWWSPTFGNI